MGSRKAEERNEKIIRGLMKLPPNRRCINCNSLGPQYVCTNFWTFVCMTCSGIHREFIHRVKSVSMSKFTSEEVEALQNGGNQLARETYLKDWDLQRQRLRNNSNVDKVREFIKNVYIDRRYAGGKTSDNPLKDMQGLGSPLGETRRASSYHSYSQSPPYDFQYEERRYGKFGAVLTRKPGSDRGNYVGKISDSSIVYGPGRLSEQMFGDRFADESSGSRISNYSVSGGGDPFTSGIQSPKFEKNVGFNSPPVQRANFKRDVNGIPHPKRSTSLGSVESFHSNSISLKSYSSGGLTDVISEDEQATRARLDIVSTFPQSHVPVNYGGLDLFEAPVVPEPVSSAVPPIDLFQLPETSAAHISEQPSTATLDRNLQVLSVRKNEGWATFDTPPPATSISGTESLPPAIVPGNEGSSVKFDQFPSSNTSMQWPIFQNSSANGPSPSSDPWPGNLHRIQAPAIAVSTEVVPGTESLSSAVVPSNGGSSVKFDQFPPPNTSMQWPAFQNSSANGPPSSGPWPGSLHSVQAPNIATSIESWNAFDDSTIHLPLEDVKQNSEPPLSVYKPSPIPDHYLTIVSQEIIDGNLRGASHDGPPCLAVPSHANMGPSYAAPSVTLMGEMQAHAVEHKSTNPFDFPCDSDLEQSNMFLDMSSLQAALPNAELPAPFFGGATQSWFTQNPVTPFVPAAAQGSLAYMSGQAPTAQLPNIPTQKPVASVGGNPFA